MKTKFFSLKNFLSITYLPITVLTLIVFSYSVFSQDDEFENYRFDDDKASTQKTPYFSLSFGGTVSFLFMNYDDINSKLKCQVPACKVLHPSLDALDALEFSGPIVGLGFNFFTALSPLVNNARLGVSYKTGSKSLEKTFNVLKEQSLDGKEITYGVNFFRNISLREAGFHFDYAFVPMKSLAILPGIGGKWGNMTLEQYMTITPADWNGGLTLSSNPATNEKLKYSYFAFEPQINIEYALTGFFMFRATGSYMFSMDSPFVKNAWTINGNNPYSGVPKGVKPQGFSVTLGLYLGLFNY